MKCGIRTSDLPSLKHFSCQARSTACVNMTRLPVLQRWGPSDPRDWTTEEFAPLPKENFSGPRGGASRLVGAEDSRSGSPERNSVWSIFWPPEEHSPSSRAFSPPGLPRSLVREWRSREVGSGVPQPWQARRVVTPLATERLRGWEQCRLRQEEEHAAVEELRRGVPCCIPKVLVQSPTPTRVRSSMSSKRERRAQSSPKLSLGACLAEPPAVFGAG
mmetsp:Transcript_23388/g.60069  ORF Transcript_23388/g.60069 Transcript_23388/m.60069 type:complete len:217 (+) Transcript_23388:76-726(+)